MTDTAFKGEGIFPLRGLVITLKCRQASTLPFFHQPALTAFLRFLAGSPQHYDLLIRLDAPESGRVRFKKGDHYRFVLIGLNGSEMLLDTLLRQLSGLPDSAPKKGDGIPFRDNWSLASVQDMFSGDVIYQLSDASLYDVEELATEVNLWRDQQVIGLQWVSPAILLKHKDRRVDHRGKELKGNARYVRDATDIDAALLLSRVQNSVADLMRRRNEAMFELPSLENLPEATFASLHVFWMDAFYQGSDKKAKNMGGVTGHLTLSTPEPLDTAWLSLLVLGQYLGIGQRSTFGWGRYILLDGDGGQSYRRVFPANSLLLMAKDEDNLSQAWRHVVIGREGSEDLLDEWAEDETDELDECPVESLQDALEKMFWGEYRPPDLRGYVIPKKTGGVRPLAVPPMFDRILQRAVQQVLVESLEPLMMTQSHGYRPGRSRITASEAIKAAWREGYRWVFEGDVHDFFDSVQWSTVKQRLRAIYFNDPLVNALMNWIKPAVWFEGECIKRKSGLPQGSPISPMLANLILDDFDSDMEIAGFKIIRYADDFVVLCKSPEEAQRAQARALSSLEEHGLTLHPDKSHITEMSDGFRYLGYLFVNDMALDVSQSNEDSLKPAQPPPPNSWLAQLGERHAEQAQSEKALASIVERITRQQTIQIGERRQSGTFVTVTGQPAVVSTLSKQMVVHRKGECVMRVPWNSIETILLLGNHQLTTQAMHEALQKNVTVHLANSTGGYKGCITHNRNSQYQSIWMQQILVFQDEDKTLYCAKAVIGSRLRHIKEVLRQRKLAGDIPVINNAIQRLTHADSLQQLLGYEGSATREYFERLATVLPDELAFKGRNRRPPRDPFNVLLSLGYTQLYTLVESVIQTKGLLPWQGFYHQPRGKHAVLASDLMEPFRHLVERSALSMVLRGELTADDFEMSGGACYISDAARRKYIAYLMQQWEVGVTAIGDGEPRTWLEHLRQQAQSIKSFVMKGEPFRAFRLR